MNDAKKTTNEELEEQLQNCKDFIKAITCEKNGELTALRLIGFEQAKELYAKIKF